MKTDYVDVFMPHFPDGVTPVAEILAGFEDLIRAGKIRYGGLSNFPAWRVAGAAVRSELGGHTPLVGIQTEYSLAERSADRELLPMAQAHGLGVVLYSPLAGGLLTGKYRQWRAGAAQRRGRAGESTGQRNAVLDAVLAVAGETGAGPVQVALAWLRHRAAQVRTVDDPDRRTRTPRTTCTSICGQWTCGFDWAPTTSGSTNSARSRSAHPTRTAWLPPCATAWTVTAPCWTRPRAAVV